MNYKIKRLQVLIAASVISVCLGSVYGWSVFAAQFKVENPDWSLAQISVVFSIMIFTYTVTSVFAGMVQDRIGPRWVATFGGIMLGTGIVMASRTASLNQLYLWHGVVAGMGIGTTYATPLPTVLKWFPDKRGTAGGFVAGIFGIGGLIFGTLAGIIIGRTGSISSALLTVGIIYLVAITISAQLLTNPPEEFLSQVVPVKKEEISSVNYTPGQMLKEPVFYIILLVFIIGSVSGLIMTGNAQELAQIFAGLGTAAAVSVVGIISIFNALGSPVFGALLDKVGGRPALIILLITCILAQVILPRANSYLSFVVAASIIMLCLGGLFGIFPTLIANFFGTKHLGTNYGLLFLGFGVAGILGPKMATTLADMARNAALNSGESQEGIRLALASGFSQAFMVGAIACVLAIILSIMIKPPVKNRIGNK